MKNMKKILAMVLAVMMILSMAACGSNNTDADTAGTGDEIPTYKVLTNATFPPFDTIDSETGAVIGFDMDLIAAIGEDQGFKVEFVDMAFEALIPSIESGNGDIIAAGMWSGDPERQAKVDFSESYYVDGAALLVKKDNTSITGLDGLTSEHKVATQIATNYADDLNEMVAENKLGEAVILDGFDTCVLQVLNGDVDAMMAGASIVQAYMNQNPDQLKVVGDKNTYEELGFAVQKGNVTLLQQINDGLANLKANGKYDELLDKWFN